MKKLMCILIGLTLSSAACAKDDVVEKIKQKIVKVQISEDGFTPIKITVQKGDELILLVTRKTDKTCIKELKAIDGSGEIKLPLNKEVKFTVGKLEKMGDVKLSCGMDMTAGIITVM